MSTNNSNNNLAAPQGLNDDPNSRELRDRKSPSATARRRPSKSGIGLTPSEIRNAFQDADPAFRKPTLGIPELCKLVCRSRSTIYHWIQEGRLDGTFQKRGKHYLFFRNRVMERLFNGPDWK